MSIKLHTHFLRRHTNDQAIVEVSGDTVDQCLNHLVKRFPTIEKELFDKEFSMSAPPGLEYDISWSSERV